jgi:hypothetical protein
MSLISLIVINSEVSGITPSKDIVLPSILILVPAAYVSTKSLIEIV